MDKYSKEDLVLVARRRRLALTTAKLWRSRVGELRELVGSITDDEEKVVEAARNNRKSYLIDGNRPTIASLTARLREMGVTTHQGITRGGMLDLVNEHADKAVFVFALDSDQTKAVAGWNKSSLLINAGPGAGKTTVVCHLAAECAAHDDKVLMLVYNREAENTLTKRLKQLGVRLIQKKRIDEAAVVGCSVMTFDKFAYQINTRMSQVLADGFEDGLEDEFEDGNVDELAGNSAFDTAGFDGTSYGRELNTAASAISDDRPGTESLPKWSVIIVDEAQDVTTVHRRLIDGVVRLNPGIRKIVAGDPRQELYPGTGWFSELWASSDDGERAVLHYNHRSSPAIVDAINIYSRSAFPSLHHEQTAALGDDDAGEGVFLHEIPCTSARWWMDKHLLTTSSQEVGRAVGSLLVRSEPGSAYAVAPVTIEKFNLGIATAAARQSIEDWKPGAILIAAHMVDKSALQNSVYIAATSRKIKGTERDAVVVYGADVEYGGVEISSLAKMLFVALSRARKTLHIVVRKLTGQRIGKLLAPVVEFLGGARIINSVVSKPTLRNTVPVVDSGMGDVSGSYGICYSDALSPEVLTRMDVDPVTIDSKGDSDFVGCFAEALVAEAMGVDLALEVVIVEEPDRNKRGIYYDPICREYAIRSAKNMQLEYEEMVVARRAADRTFLAYEHARMKFSVLCGKVWTVSRHVVADRDHYKTMQAQAARLVGSLFGADGGAAMISSHAGVEYSVMFEHELTTERDGSRAGSVVYVPDLMIDGIPVELKHTDETTPNHRRQAGIYAALRGAPYAILVNTKLGMAERIKPLTTDAVEATSRALLAMSVGQAALSRLEARAIRPPKSLTPSCIVSVDVEKSVDGHVTEIGAVAFSATDRAVISTFRAVADGVGVAPRPGDEPATLGYLRPGGYNIWAEKIEQMTGLRVENRDAFAAGSKALVARFRTWARSLPTLRTFIYWGGSEAELLSGVAGETCDVYNGLFRPWLDHGGQMRQGSCRLSDAAQQVVGGFKFTPHRAYEDALATGSVFVGIVSFSGVV